ncbi:MAG: hypothetical protein ABW136_04605 [Steroidobacteraceae bacterium]
MGNTLDRLQDAMVVLSQNGTVKDRLAQAWHGHLAGLDAGVLPDSLRAEFRGLCDALQRERPLPRENPALASVRKMSSDEANRHAAFVVRLYAAMARGDASAPPTRPVVRASGSVVPLFAAEG